MKSKNKLNRTSEIPPESRRLTRARKSKGKIILIPEYASDYTPADLPISVRLEHALKNKKVVRLADLNGCYVGELKALGNCGQRTCDELTAMIKRLAAGEFRPASGDISTSATAEVLRLIDQAIKELPPQLREILILRYGGGPLGRWTLDGIALKSQLTRKRILQIVQVAVEQVRKMTAAKINPYLRSLEASCSEKVCPLNPAWLSELLANGTAGRYPVVFYVRLLGELNPAIPVWAEEKSKHPVPGRPSEILKATSATFREGEQRVPLRSAWKRVCEQMGESAPGPQEFLEALRHAPLLVVEFRTPDRGTVRIRQTKQERWEAFARANL